jgi:hypothetical protein
MSVNGRFLGGPAPFGFNREDGVLVPVPAQQAAIQRMHKMRGKGMSLRAIADVLTDNGTPISHMGVKRVLNRE